MSAHRIARPRPTRPRIGAERASVRAKGAVEDNALEPDVSVEVLQVAQPRHAAERVRADRGRAVHGKVHLPRLGQVADLQQPGDAAAPGDIGMQAVDRADVQERGEVRQHEAVLARGDVQSAACIVRHTAGGAIASAPFTKGTSFESMSAAVDTSP